MLALPRDNPCSILKTPFCISNKVLVRKQHLIWSRSRVVKGFPAASLLLPHVCPCPTTFSGQNPAPIVVAIYCHG